ncbi:MAG: erythromycin esterase family protein [Gemmatimonadales bacterium]|nr:erythromycin esterase family protein [Gemmatimonadales bacterium]
MRWHNILRDILAIGVILAGILVSPPAVSGQGDSVPSSAATRLDPRVVWLREHAIQLRSVSPADEDWTDLEPLKDVLGEASIVMLGEESHGDGATFLAKTRLIKFLHQEMGFDVLAFESGLYDIWKAWEALARGEEPSRAIARGLFSLWAGSEQVEPLVEYLAMHAKSKRPLELAGFDIQMSGTASRESLVADLTHLLNQLGIGQQHAPDWGHFTSLLLDLATKDFVRGTKPLPPRLAQDRFAAVIGWMQATLSRQDIPIEARTKAFWRQVLESLDAYAAMVWLVDPSDLRPRPDDAEIREAQMTRNLLWLARMRYPGKRIVVWAATSHIARGLSELESGIVDIQTIYDQVPTLGERVWKALGTEVYSLGFTAYEGTAGMFFQSPRDIGRSSDGSLEELMTRAGLEFAVLDFRNPAANGDWLRQPIVARPLGYREMYADWTRFLDGMVFTKRMTPSTRVER